MFREDKSRFLQQGRHPEGPRFHQRDEGSGVQQHSPTTKSKGVGQECPTHTDKGHAGGPDHPDVVRGLAATDDLMADG